MLTTPSDRYILDTCFILHYLRQREVWRIAEERYDFTGKLAAPMICAVTLGELQSFTTRNDWPEKKKKRLNLFLKEFIVQRIDVQEIYDAYADIDKFSQKPGSGMSSRNMGKNDLWIAAAAKATGRLLLTCDDHFDHLHSIHLHRVYINPSSSEIRE